jgi:hypothetical protein
LEAKAQRNSTCNYKGERNEEEKEKENPGLLLNHVLE